MIRSKGKTFTVMVGNIKPYTMIASGKDAAGYADSLRSEIYLMLASEHPGWEGAVAVVNDKIEEKDSIIALWRKK